MAAAMSLLDRGGSVVMIEKHLDPFQDSFWDLYFYWSFIAFMLGSPLNPTALESWEYRLKLGCRLFGFCLGCAWIEGFEFKSVRAVGLALGSLSFPIFLSLEPQERPWVPFQPQRCFWCRL